MDVFQILFNLAIAAGVISVGVVVAIAFVIAYGARHVYYAIRGEEYVPLLGSGKKYEYEHQDIHAGSTSKSIRKVLDNYSRLDIVGKYARSGIAALDDDERKRAHFMAVLDKKFQPHSLSWDKFAVAADSTHEAVLENCATLANRIQVFDRNEYRRADRTRRSSTYRKKTEMLDPVTADKLRVMQSSMNDMDGLVTANQQLLVELDKLTLELSKLTDAGANENSERIVEEIRTLIDETKYYS